MFSLLLLSWNYTEWLMSLIPFLFVSVNRTKPEKSLNLQEKPTHISARHPNILVYYFLVTAINCIRRTASPPKHNTPSGTSISLPITSYISRHGSSTWMDLCNNYIAFDSYNSIFKPAKIIYKSWALRGSSKLPKNTD